MIFTALFTNLDGIVKAKAIEASLKHLFSVDGDEEVIINKKEYEKIASLYPDRDIRIGGNAANASIALHELSIPSVLSAPCRNDKIIERLPENVKLVCDNRIKRPELCKRKNDDAFEHIIIELPEGRKILTYDRMSSELWLDEDFWGMIRKASLLYISGFHLVNPEYRKKIDYVCDMIEESNAKVWLEAGTGTESMDYAIKRMLERQLITHIGMNDNEADRMARINGIVAGKMIDKMLLLAERLLEEYGIHVTIHSRDFRVIADRNIRRYAEACRISIELCARMSSGWKVGVFKKSGMQEKIFDNSAIIPTLVNENPEIVAGMGDRAAITEFAISNNVKINAKIKRKEKK